MSTYFTILVLSLSVPFVYSFHRKLKFYQDWKYLFPAIFITLTLFIIWDVIFTDMGIWGFNPMHLSGINVVNLPLEEWLFFIVIPYVCVFTYASLNYYIKKDIFKPVSNYISWAMIIGFALVAAFNYDRLYTFYTFTFTSVFIFLVHVVFKVKFLSRFYFSYMIILFPFLIVNGFLTGSWIPEEVVYYNNEENLGIRVLTIPIEDSVYGLLLIMMNTTIFEYLKSRFSRSIPE
jgi:lycopene cyclase domain-containing protein